MNETIRVVVVDDHQRFRAAVTETLGRTTDIQVIAEGANATEAIQLACTLQPDLILLDMRMPGCGLYAARMIASLCPATRIVLFTVGMEADDLHEAQQAGVHAYILKGVSARELVRIVRIVAVGEVYIPASVADFDA